MYAYVRNNPTTLTDPTGLDVTLGKCSGSTASTCFQRVLNGLRKEDRSHVHLVAGNGKNGFAKGVSGITVDTDYRSTSGNFKILQSLANDHSATAVLSVLGPKETFSDNVGVKQGDRVVLQPFKSIYGVANYVSRADAVPGQTLYRLFGSPLENVQYSPDATARAYVANDQSDVEITKTIYHELDHVYLGDFGRSVVKGEHGSSGVNASTRAAENEAEENDEQ